MKDFQSIRNSDSFLVDEHAEEGIQEILQILK